MRYREIVHVLARHGFGELIDQLELLPYLSLPRRLLRGAKAREPLGAPARVRMALEELGPTFIKFGQILSTRPDLLPPAYIQELSKLQDTVPPAPWEQVRARVEEELGDSLEVLFAEFEPEPLAAASLSQVHAARLPAGQEVVVKVQRPSIQDTIETDLEILFDLARLAQERTPLGQLYDLVEIAEDFAVTLRNELDYQREGRNADRFRHNFAGEKHLYIPQVYWDYTTTRVLVLERIYGIKIDHVAAIEAAGLDRHQIALNAARILIKEVLEDGFFHADPHPGNFVVMPGEVIGAMDFGMVGYLNRRMKEDLVRLFIASVEMDTDAVVDQLIRMGAVGEQLDRPRLRRDLERLITRYQGMPLRDIQANQVMSEVMPVAFRHRLHLPSDLWLLGKTLSMLEGVGRQLDPDFDVLTVAQPYVRQFVWEMSSPIALGRRLQEGITDWSQLLLDLPNRMPRLLDQLERGEATIGLDIRRADEILGKLDRIANRLAISLLLAAFIVALALLIPSLDMTWPWGSLVWMVVIGFVVVSLLGLWLLISIWRSGRQ